MTDNWWRCPRGHRLLERSRSMSDGNLVVLYHPCILCARLPEVPDVIPDWMTAR